MNNDILKDKKHIHFIGIGGSVCILWHKYLIPKDTI